MRCRQVIGQRECAGFEFCFGRLGILFLPFANLGIECFKLRGTNIEGGQDLSRRTRCQVGEGAQPGFLPSQCFRFFLLTRCFQRRPMQDRITGHRLNAADSRGNRTFGNNLETGNVAGGARVRAGTKFHGISVQLLRLAADLHHADGLAVFVAEKLHDVRAAAHFRIGNLPPRNRDILCNALVDELFDGLDLLRGERRAVEIEGQFLRPDKRTFLGGFRRDDFVQSPMQKVRDGVVTLDGFAAG